MRIVSWVILIAWIGTFFRTILNLLLVPRLPRDAPSYGPIVSVIVPARNEEMSIEATVRGFLSQTYGPIEVIVVNDRSTDATGSILERFSDSRLRVISGDEPPQGWLGKPWALHQGSRAASGDIFLFADADILYSPWAVASAVARLRASEAAMISLFPRFIMDTFGERLILPLLVMALWSFLPSWLANRTKMPILGIGGGTGNLVWREVYEGAGGHEALRAAVIDDVGLARLIRRAGGRTEIVRADDGISVRMYRGGRETIAGFTKNVFAAFGRSYILALLFSGLGVLFHVLPYGRALSGDLISIVTVAVITATRVILFAALGYPLVHALFAHPFTVLVWTWISLRSMWFTGIRKRLAWRGRTYDAAATRFGADR